MRTIWKKYFNLLSATAIHFRAIFPFYIYEFNMLQSVRCDDDDGTRSKSKWSRSLENTHTQRTDKTLNYAFMYISWVWTFARGNKKKAAHTHT